MQVFFLAVRAQRLSIDTYRLGRRPTYTLDILTETPVLADLATKNVVTLLTGYLQ